MTRGDGTICPARVVNKHHATFTLKLVKDRLQGEMLAELEGQSFTATVDVGRAK